jgi:hypothetical protein
MFQLLKLKILILIEKMYADILHLKEPLIATLLKFKNRIPHLQLEDSEWALIERYHQIFKIFKKPLDKLQGIYFFLYK